MYEDGNILDTSYYVDNTNILSSSEEENIEDSSNDINSNNNTYYAEDSNIPENTYYSDNDSDDNTYYAADDNSTNAYYGYATDDNSTTEESCEEDIISDTYESGYLSDDNYNKLSIEKENTKDKQQTTSNKSFLDVLQQNEDKEFTNFPEFFQYIQQKNIAISIERPSIKLSRSLRFSGHHSTANKMEIYINNYLTDSININTNKSQNSSQSTAINTKGRDWNDEFQTLIDLPDSRVKFLGLRNLAHDFVYASETYGKIIISEYCLPDDMKTIKPINIGGIAGGLKFICQGILFKFAIDFSGIYSGDENAMKAASHELKGLTNYFHCGIKKLHFPLMAFIDYRGFRLMALSLLPIGSKTICYGSADAGKSVHNSDLHMNDIAKRIGKILNLKKHLVGVFDTPIYGPADIEGHKGKDKRYYMLDFARVAPPQPPTAKGQQLYNLYRMEFVVNYKKPLCSDGFTGFGKHNAIEHKQELKEAFIYYNNEVIPDIAKTLDTLSIDKTNQHIITIIHKKGMNIRHIGKLRSHITNTDISSLILLEGIARSIKSHLNELLRLEMQKCSIPSEKPFRQVILDLFNLILNNNEDFSYKYWNKQLKDKINEKYPTLLTDKELSLNNLSECINMFSLFERIQELTNIKISNNAMNQLKLSPNTFELVEPDINILNRVVHLNLIDYADGMSLYYEAENRSSNPETQYRLLSLAYKRLESSLSQSGHSNFIAILQLGNISRTLAMKANTSSDKLEYYKKAEDAFKSLSESKCDNSMKFKSYFLWAKTLWTRIKSSKNLNEDNKDLQITRELLEKSLHIQSNELCSIILLAKIYFHQTLDIIDTTIIENRLSKALQILLEWKNNSINTGNDVSLPADYIFIKAKIMIHYLANEMLIKDNSHTTLHSLIKETTSLLSDAITISNVNILNHYTIPQYSILPLLVCLQYSHETLMNLISSAINNQCNHIKIDSNISLWLSDTTCIPLLLEKCTNIQTITIDSNLDCELLKNILEKANQILNIEINNVSISLKELEQIFSSLSNNINSISLGNINFTDITLNNDSNNTTQISNITKCFSLIPLSLQIFKLISPQSTINDNIIKQILLSLSSNITHLQITKCENITNNTLDVIQDHFSSNLEILQLNDCIKLTNHQILLKLTKLCKLNVHGCSFDLIDTISDIPSNLAECRTFISSEGLLQLFSGNSGCALTFRNSTRFNELLSISVPQLGEFMRITRKPNLRAVNIIVGLRDSASPISCTEHIIGTVSFREIGQICNCTFSSTYYQTNCNFTLSKTGSMNNINLRFSMGNKSIIVAGLTNSNKTIKLDCLIDGNNIGNIMDNGTFSPTIVRISPNKNIIFTLLPLLIPYIFYGIRF